MNRIEVASREMKTTLTCHFPLMSVILQELLPVGNKNFDVNKFYADLLPDATDGDGLVEVAAQKFEDLMSVVKKRVHKKRAAGRLRLDLGGGVKLGVSTYSFCQRAYKPSKVRLTR